MCCTRLGENTTYGKKRKNRRLRTIAQLCWAISSQLRQVSTVGKTVKQQHLLNMFSQYGELRPANGRDRFGNLGHPSKFQRISHLGFVTAAMSLNGGQPNFARCLVISWADTLHTTFLGLLSPNGILPKFSLRSALAFSCIGSVTAWHSRNGRKPNFAAWKPPTGNGITELSLLVIFNRGRHLYSKGGRYVGHRPTFYCHLF